MTYVRSTVVGVASSDPRRYMTIAAYLREQISNGRLAPGQAIPSITVLCRQYEYSRITVGKGLRVLEKEGLLLRMRGRSYHVCGEGLNGVSAATEALLHEEGP
jgi:DNA-binding GntR family transcriptional regulator